jgi:AbrB family looped-hinge helix DNA binding protein
MELKARITSKGQLTIPKEVRRALGVGEGDNLLFEVNETGDEVTVRVARKPVSFADYAGIWREDAGMSLKEVNSYVRELRGHES